MAKKLKFDETQFLSILEKVLPQATRDSKLAHSIYEGVAKEIRIATKLADFQSFCEKSGLADLAPETVNNLQSDLKEAFGEENVVVTPDQEKGSLAVEITLPDRLVATEVRVQAVVEEEVPTAPYVPFPVSLPDDPELVWMLARREDFGPDEACRALGLIEEEFWGTKAGQKLLKSGCERTFADFIQHVPASALADSSMKRLYKTPETLKVIRVQPSEAARLGEPVGV